VPGVRGKDWITDVVHMQASHKLAVLSMDNCVTFYDLGTESKKSIGGVSPSMFKQAAPLSVDYYHDPALNKELLMIGKGKTMLRCSFHQRCSDCGILILSRLLFHTKPFSPSLSLLCPGDDIGGITVFTFDDRNWHLCDGSLECHDKPTKEHVSYFRIHKHEDHITKLQYIPDLGCIISASLDSTLLVVDLERRRVKRTFTQHKKAVYSFAWCNNSKVVASCGLERDIILWSTYSKRSMATLHGHTASVISMVNPEETNLLISLSVDNTIRIWDIRNQKCIQVLVDDNSTGYLSYAPITAMCYNTKNKTLYTACNTIKMWRQMEPVTKGKHSSHSATVTGALYNRSFQQVISADIETATVNVWNMESGEIQSKFDVSEDTSSSVGSYITTMCFDGEGRRLITGGHDGDSIKVWNFSNGSVLQTFLKTHKSGVESDDESNDGDDDNPKLKNPINLRSPRVPHSPRGRGGGGSDFSLDDPLVPESSSSNGAKKASEYGANETTCVTYVTTCPTNSSASSYADMNKYIVAAGWDRKVYVWRDGDNGSSNDDGYLLRMPESGVGHTDDILCLIFVAPHWIATGSNDNQVILWNVNSGIVGKSFDMNGPVDRMVFLDRINILVCTSRDGTLKFLDVNTSQMYVIVPPKATPDTNITAIHVDQSGDYLFTGDSTGSATVWTVSSPIGDPMNFAKCLSQWKAHNCGITCIDYIEYTRIMDTFLLTAGENGDLSLWTLTGSHVGIFGQETPWSLSDRSTYANLDESPIPVWRNRPVNTDKKHSFRRSSIILASPGGDAIPEKRRASLSTSQITNSNVNSKSYKVSSVWVRKNSSGELIDVITITRVDEVQNLIAGWDGLVDHKPGDPKPPSITMTFQDMMKVRDKLPWEEEVDLGLRIGRIFSDSTKIPAVLKRPEDAYPSLFKTLFLRFRLGQWLCVDTNFEEHPLNPLNSRQLPSRSLSMCKRDILVTFEKKIAEKELRLMENEDLMSRAASAGREKQDKALEKINQITNRKKSIAMHSLSAGSASNSGGSGSGDSIDHSKRLLHSGLLSHDESHAGSSADAQPSSPYSHKSSSLNLKSMVLESHILEESVPKKNDPSALPPLLGPGAHQVTELGPLAMDSLTAYRRIANSKYATGKSDGRLGVGGGGDEMMTGKKQAATTPSLSGSVQLEYQLSKSKSSKYKSYATDKRKVQNIVDVPEAYAKFRTSFRDQLSKTPKSNMAISTNDILALDKEV
jgi:WD40 repeat protein